MSIIGKTIKFHVGANDVKHAVVLDKYRTHGAAGDSYLCQMLGSGEVVSIFPMDVASVQDTPNVAPPCPQ